MRGDVCDVVRQRLSGRRYHLDKDRIPTGCGRIAMIDLIVDPETPRRHAVKRPMPKVAIPAVCARFRPPG